MREPSGGAGQVRALLAQQCVQLEDVPAHTARGHGAWCGRRWPCLLLLLLAVVVVVWWRRWWWRRGQWRLAPALRGRVDALDLLLAERELGPLKSEEREGVVRIDRGARVPVRKQRRTHIHDIHACTCTCAGDAGADGGMVGAAEAEAEGLQQPRAADRAGASLAAAAVDGERGLGRQRRRAVEEFDDLPWRGRR